MRTTTAWEAAFMLRVWSSTFEVKCRTNLEEWSGFSCVCTRGPLMILLPHFLPWYMLIRHLQGGPTCSVFVQFSQVLDVIRS